MLIRDGEVGGGGGGGGGGGTYIRRHLLAFEYILLYHLAAFSPTMEKSTRCNDKN